MAVQLSPTPTNKFAAQGIALGSFSGPLINIGGATRFRQVPSGNSVPEPA